MTSTNSRVVNDFLINEDGQSMSSRRNALLSAKSLLKHFTPQGFERLQTQWQNAGSGERGQDVRVTLDEFHDLLRPMIIAGGQFNESGARIELDNDDDVESLLVSRRMSSSASNLHRVGSSALLECRTRRNDLENYIRDLFITIDVPRNGTLSWEEFVSFVIEDMMRTSGGRRAVGPEQQQQRDHDDRENDDMAAKSKKLRRVITTPSHQQDSRTFVFNNDCTARDPAIRVSIMETKEWYPRVYYFEEIDRVVTSWKHRVISAHPTALGPRFHEQHVVAEHTHDVFCCEYLPNVNLLATASRSPTKPIALWRPGINGMTPKGSIGFDSSVSEDDAWINVMRYTNRISSERVGQCLMGTRGGSIHCVEFTSTGVSDDWKMKMIEKYSVHKGAVTDLLVLPSSGSIVSCGVDGRVCILNTFHDPSSRITDLIGHTRGVYSLSLSQEYNYIVSAGYEGFALCFVANMGRHAAFRLEDASAKQNPLVGVRCLPNSPHVVTLDQRGIYKLFDIRTVRAIESWKITDSVSSGHFGSNPTQGHECVSSFAYTGSAHRQLVAGGRRLYVYDHHAKATQSPRLAHSAKETIIAVVYSPATDEFVTATSRYITVWSGLTGVPKCSHHHLADAPIRTIALDPTTGKLLLGLENGDITAHVLETGVQIRRYLRHDYAITTLVIDPHNSLIFSGSEDQILCIWYDEDSMTEQRLLDLNRKVSKAPALSTLGQQMFHAVDVKDLLSVRTRSNIRRTNVEAAANRMLKSLNRTSDPTKNRTVTSSSDARNVSPPPNAKDTATVVHTPECRLQLDARILQVLVQPRQNRFIVLFRRDPFIVFSMDKFPKPSRTHRSTVERGTEITMGCLVGDRPQLVLIDTVGRLQLWSFQDSDGGGSDDKKVVDAVKLRHWYNHTPMWKPHTIDKNIMQELLSFGKNFTVSHSSSLFRSNVSMSSSASSDADEADETATVDVAAQSRLNSFAETNLPTRIVPTVNCLAYDDIRNLLVTADDRGCVNVWDVVTPMLQHTVSEEPALINHFVATEDANSISALVVIQHPILCLVTADTGNNVTLSLFDGQSIASLRQGPLAERYWNFIDHEPEQRRCVTRLRWGKIKALCKAVLAQKRRKFRSAFRSSDSRFSASLVNSCETNGGDFDGVEGQNEKPNFMTLLLDATHQHQKDSSSSSSRLEELTSPQQKFVSEKRPVPKVVVNSDLELTALLQRPDMHFDMKRRHNQFKQELYRNVEESHKSLCELTALVGTTGHRGKEDTKEEHDRESPRAPTPAPADGRDDDHNDSRFHLALKQRRRFSDADAPEATILMSIRTDAKPTMSVPSSSLNLTEGEVKKKGPRRRVSMMRLGGMMGSELVPVRSPSSPKKKKEQVVDDDTNRREEEDDGPQLLHVARANVETTTKVNSLSTLRHIQRTENSKQEVVDTTMTTEGHAPPDLRTILSFCDHNTGKTTAAYEAKQQELAERVSAIQARRRHPTKSQPNTDGGKEDATEERTLHSVLSCASEERDRNAGVHARARTTSPTLFHEGKKTPVLLHDGTTTLMRVSMHQQKQQNLILKPKVKFGVEGRNAPVSYLPGYKQGSK
eukprot:PhM_4_TR1334/c0_g1_i1/m.48693